MIKRIDILRERNQQLEDEQKQVQAEIKELETKEQLEQDVKLAEAFWTVVAEKGDTVPVSEVLKYFEEKKEISPEEAAEIALTRALRKEPGTRFIVKDLFEELEWQNISNAPHAGKLFKEKTEAEALDKLEIDLSGKQAVYTVL